MSSDSEMSEFSDMSGNPKDEDVEEGNDEDYDVIYSEITPYQDESLAQVDTGDKNTGEEIEVDEELDEDGLTPTLLEARYEKRVPVNMYQNKNLSPNNIGDGDRREGRETMTMRCKNRSMRLVSPVVYFAR